MKFFNYTTSSFFILPPSAFCPLPSAFPPTQITKSCQEPDFGSGLLSLVFSPNSPELAAAMQTLMQAAIERWLGDLIEIQTLDVTSEDSTLRITLQYLLRLTGELRTSTFEQIIP